MVPSIAQLVERWTVEVIVIHRSLVRIRLEGVEFFSPKFQVNSPCILFRSIQLLYIHVHTNSFFFLAAYNVPDLEKKPTATVSRPLRGHLSRVTSLYIPTYPHIVASWIELHVVYKGIHVQHHTSLGDSVWGIPLLYYMYMSQAHYACNNFFDLFSLWMLWVARIRRESWRRCWRDSRHKSEQGG